MCISTPGKVINIKKDMATVLINNEEIEAKIVDPITIGDYVIVQGRVIIDKVSKEEYDDFYTLLNEG